MWKLYNEDYIIGVNRIQDNSIDLVIADPPYGLGKDYGNDSDMKNNTEIVEYTEHWLNLTLPKMKESGSIYIFTSWRNSPEIFSMMKKKLTMINEIIWDRCVPSMGGSTRKFSSVHDTVGLFVMSKDYYFDIDSVRIPYDKETKKARTRSIFVGKKWLELGCNPKDVWKISRLHKQHKEREDHPTQKPMILIERMIKASCPSNGLVLDPFVGSGTTIDAAHKLGRNSIGFEINSNYCDVINNRMNKARLF